MKKLLLLLGMLALFFHTKAQNAHLYFDRLDVKTGLPEAYVRFIVEDNEGYIWVATQNGLVRYDGYRHKIYQLGSDKLNVTAVTNVFGLVADDAHKTIWVSTAGNGLFRYNRATDTFDQFINPASDNLQYPAIKTVDGDGNVWGAINYGPRLKIFKFDIKTRRYQLFSKRDKGNNYINADDIHSIQKTADNQIWLATSNGLYRYDGQDKPLKGLLTTTDTAKMIGVNPVYQPSSQPGVLWANLFHGNNINLRLACIDIKTGKIIREYYPSKSTDSLSNAGIYAIHEDKRKQLWLATQTGLSKLDRQSHKFTNYLFPDTAIKELSSITESRDGKFWIRPFKNLLYFDPESGKHQFYKSKPAQQGALVSQNITTTMVDRTNTLWLGLAYSGVNKLSKLKSAFELVKEAAGKPNGYPGGTPQLVSSNAKITRFTTRQGVFNWDTETGKFSPVFSVSPDQLIRCVVADGDVLYIGNSSGFIVYNTATGKKDTYRNNPTDSTSIASTAINSIFKDHEGIFWLSTANDQGICSFNPITKKFTRYRHHNNYDKLFTVNDGALDDGRVITIYEDRENTLWVGTNSGSLNRFDRKTGTFFSYFNKRNERMSCVSAIYEDRAGRFWVGTYLNGVFEFDRKKGIYTRQINERSGLLYNSIMGIKEDVAGRIWIGTGRGISRLDAKTKRLTNYHIDDILPGSDMVLFERGNMADGRFAIGLKNGFALFAPEDLDDDPYPPVVHLETILYNTPGANDSLATKILTYGRVNLKLAYNQNSVQFNYIALHYENPAKNTYAYMLVGYDKQWVQAGTSRTVTYNNLPPGTYTFRVKAANSSGVWNEEGDKITVVINAPWWSTWWAWVLYLLLLGAAIYFYIAFRSRHLKMENYLLEQKVESRTNELTEANKELNEQQEEITAQRDQLANTVNELKNTQQQLVQSEKLASLGELTAGIAHEIQNPLNFVNNFSEVSVELAIEMKQELISGSKTEAMALADDIALNLEKIIHHGKRADGIVKNMLQHSRNNAGDKQLTDINALADEYLRLSYHGLRAKDKAFNSGMVADFDPDVPKISIIPQDIGRVMLNLFNNAFYAVQQRRINAAADYKPIVEVTTRVFTPPSGKSQVRIYVKDNGSGIPDAIKDKIMQPFFTTKPTGEGTGLGLSLSYDIIVKGHGGSMDVKSKEGEYSEFVISLPVA